MITPLEIRAVPSPLGHRVDLEWVHPDPQAYPGMRIVRRRGAWPASPEDGEVLLDEHLLVDERVQLTVDPDGRSIARFRDEGLAGETVYYYLLVPFAGSPSAPDQHFDERNRAAAMATASYGYGDRLATLLPAIYHRYDAQQVADGPSPEDLLPGDEDKGPLRRFLDLAGSHLDQFHSLARAALDLHDPDRLDGRLLPLLAQWIGWPVDHRLGYDAQRGEIRQAPYIHRGIGLIPTVEATVKRVLGLESRVKEMAHNVALSNRAPRMNLWLATPDGAGGWTEPAEPLALHDASEGRPTAALDGGGTQWLFFHTRRKASQAKWTGLSQNGTETVRHGQWDIWFKIFTTDDGWSESRPLTDSAAVDKHPSAALQQPGGQSDTLWVFWDSWTEESRGQWSLGYRTLRDGTWSERQVLWAEDGVERRRPQAVADGLGGLWFFWQEKTASGTLPGRGRWQTRYTRHDGTDWDPVHRDLRDPLEADPRVEDDLVLFVDASSRLWAFWARRDRDAGGRWRVAYRVKADLDPASWNWGDVAELPLSDSEASDREPAVVAGSGGELEVYWSSNRDRSWSVWRASLDLVSLAWGAPEALTGHPHSQRAPLVVGAADEMLLYTSDRGVTYDSTTYSATRTVDQRYAGSTTADVRNVAKTALRGSFRDCQAYTFDTGTDGRRGDDNWYGHDTVALYVTPSSEDPDEVQRQRDVLQQVLRQFLPIQVRGVLVLEPPPFQELAYTYEFPDAATPRVIGEQTFDSTLTEVLGPVNDGYVDVAPQWARILSTTPNHTTVDFNADPIDTSKRTWHVGLSDGSGSGE